MHADVIVIGTGGVGSAALMHLARRGVHALGIDRFDAGHDRGSSHGQTRVIRQAYFEHAGYVPLLLRAYELWNELEQTSGRQLYYQTGLLEVGPADGVVVPGVLRATREHQLHVDELTAREVRQQFRAFECPDNAVGVFEQQAGYLLVEDCVRTHIQQAINAGATHHVGESVVSWSAENDGIRVITNRATYTADALIIAGGAWANDLLNDLGIRLRVLRKHLHWFANSDERYAAQNGCPTFFYESPEGLFYGFPQIDGRGVKLAEHSGGELVPDPLSIDRSVDKKDLDRVRAFTRQALPGLSSTPTDHAICMYTMSPDEHFIVDRHPTNPRVVFAAGLSGHGFKFTSVLGEVLAKLVDTQEQEAVLADLEFLRHSPKRYDSQ